MEKDINFNIISRFCVFAQCFTFENTLKQLPKWTLQ